MKAYLVDIGILLDSDDKEFDFYACVYDKKWGYYDINQYYVPTLEQAKEEVKKYVKETENSYGIVSITELEDDFDFEDCQDIQEDYLVENIEYSFCNTNNGFEDDFVEGQKGVFKPKFEEESEADKKFNEEMDRAWEEHIENMLDNNLLKFPYEIDVVYSTCHDMVDKYQKEPSEDGSKYLAACYLHYGKHSYFHRRNA